MTTKTTAKNDAHLPEHLLKASSILQKGATVSVEGTVGNVVLEEGALEKILPEGQSVDGLIKAQNTLTDLVTAAKDAVGALGVDCLKNHKEITTIKLPALKLGKDVLSVTLDRTRIVSSPTGESTERSNWLSHKYESHSGKNGAQSKRVRDHYSKQIVEG